MALIFADGFDHYSASQITTKWTNNNTGFGSIAFSGPGRLGYGQYVNLSSYRGSGGAISRALPTALTSLIVGAAVYSPSVALGGSLFSFGDSGAGNLGTVIVGAAGQVYYNNSAQTTVVSSLNGIVNAQAWFYLECQVTFSNSSAGAVTVRVNGQTVANAANVNTSGTNPNPCGLFYIEGPDGGAYFDDLYILNTTAPNNTFLGDIKILPLYPTGNGRISGFSRFGGTTAGNYTAVNENPPDGDVSYVYSATPGTIDAYTITSLSNVATIKAVQLNGYVRKDDTPSRIVALGVGNGTTENFNAGTSVNTTYTYITRQLDQNPLTSATWVPGDFTTLQSAVQLVS